MKLIRIIRIFSTFATLRLDRNLPKKNRTGLPRLFLWFLKLVPEPKSTGPESTRIALEKLGPIFIKFGQILSTRKDLFSQEMYIDHRSGLIVFPQVREIEEAMIRSRTPKMYTGAMTLRTPGPGSEFYSLREYVPGDPFKIINWKLLF